ncbi:MAG TPA: hypothetical protein VHF90_06005 [Thermoleophilaceae bacterium]|nr:hypothetical protein [Thermoleophilaceae bacterium]
MPNSRHTKPSQAQERLLRNLAMERGESFPTPRTAADAGAQIRRLLDRQRTPDTDIARERREIAADMATKRGGAATPRSDELDGHGSTAAWSSETRPLLTVLHSREAGTTLDGTTAGDGAAEHYGFRWSPQLGRWYEPGSANRPPNYRRLRPLAAELCVCGFEVELPDD